MSKGLFITFDGPNGAGKSSIIIGVKTQLAQMSFEIIKTKEPTSSQLGQFVKNAEEDYNGFILACLIAADRYFHIEHEILPAISAGKIVLCDRYVESSLVLQRLDGVEIDFIWLLNSFVVKPDLSVILLAQPDTLAHRLAQRTQFSRFEKSKSRIDELKYYKEAAEFLSQHGFNIMLIENDTTPIEENIKRVVTVIQILIEKRSA